MMMIESSFAYGFAPPAILRACSTLMVGFMVMAAGFHYLTDDEYNVAIGFCDDHHGDRIRQIFLELGVEFEAHLLDRLAARHQFPNHRIGNSPVRRNRHFLRRELRIIVDADDHLITRVQFVIRERLRAHRGAAKRQHCDHAGNPKR